MQNNVDSAEPSTSSAAASPQPSAAEPAAAQDGQETLPAVKDMSDPPSILTVDKIEGDKEEVIEEAPKKSSTIRFRRKPKQPKKQRSKGLCFH